MKAKRNKVEQWAVRNAETGVLLGWIDSNDIDDALSMGRMFFGHNVTVDNVGPQPRDLTD